MNTTNLNLLFIDNTDPKILYLQDVSEYNPDITVDLSLLEITPPNFSTSYVLSYPVLTTIPINSNALGLTNTDEYECLTILNDGLWLFKQMINGCIIKTTKHFRITNLKLSIYEYVSEQMDLSSPNCNLDDNWYEDIYKLLTLLESAKYLCECCDKCVEATIIYNQVKNAFKKYNSCSSC